MRINARYNTVKYSNKVVKYLQKVLSVTIYVKNISNSYIEILDSMPSISQQ